MLAGCRMIAHSVMCGNKRLSGVMALLHAAGIAPNKRAGVGACAQCVCGSLARFSRRINSVDFFYVGSAIPS